jgi:hypothetical protein
MRSTRPKSPYVLSADSMNPLTIRTCKTFTDTNAIPKLDFCHLRWRFFQIETAKAKEAAGQIHRANVMARISWRRCFGDNFSTTGL